MSIWKFTVEDEMVRYGDNKRQRLTTQGCNEPFRGRYWCPKLKWFRKESCPFTNQRECTNFEAMCGSL
ncbi:MAG: hypothetical protein OEV91_01885 [Desulfobulbaceae bacterium]|nr:hypothetical protein [Desulfobulbaceae bacterium]